MAGQRPTFDKLNERQRRFVLAYARGMSGRRAAVEAGYSEKTAGPQAGRLLSNVIVKTAIREIAPDGPEIASIAEIHATMTAWMRGQDVDKNLNRLAARMRAAENLARWKGEEPAQNTFNLAMLLASDNDKEKK